MKYKLAIFDLDGTTLNTIEDLAISLNYALEKSDFPKRSLTEVLSFVGNGIQKLIERGVPDGTSYEKTKAVFDDFTVHYKEHCADNTRPYDGIIDMLNTLKNKGYLLATVSNKADYAVQILCRDYFPGLFDAVAGEKPEIRKKPAPDTVNIILEKLNIRREDAVYIGDSEVDIATAKNANMDCISVDWGFRTREQLIEAGAAKIVSSPNEIIASV